MPIPDYQTLMLPVLRLASDGQEHKFARAIEQLAEEFGLTDDERNELLPSGTQAVFNNRVGWARSYLKQAGLLDTPRRGFFTISERGRELLANAPERIDAAVLEQYPEFIEFKNRKKKKKKEGGNETSFAGIGGRRARSAVFTRRTPSIHGLQPSITAPRPCAAGCSVSLGVEKGFLVSWSDAWIGVGKSVAVFQPNYRSLDPDAMDATVDAL